MINEQHALNQLAAANDIKIQLFSGWKVTSNKDGNIYLVKNNSELHALVNNLIKENAHE
jgi:hypothetical protein